MLENTAQHLHLGYVGGNSHQQPPQACHRLPRACLIEEFGVLQNLLEMPEQAREGQAGHLRELLELLESLGPDDRERLLDLARRLAAKR